jgi:hypothetical protein
MTARSPFSLLRTRTFALVASSALAVAGLGAAATSANAVTPACGNSSLAVTHTPDNGATGHDSFVLLFRNVSHSTCTIFGYPGLDGMTAKGKVLVHAKRTLHGFAGGVKVEKTVTVAAGHYAFAVAEWMDFNPKTSGPCKFSSYVLATPANTSHTVKLHVSVSNCDLQIHPTEAGTDGNNQFAYAQRQWILGRNADAADQGLYWHAAKVDLAVDHSRYSSQVTELKELIALPDTGLTSAQIAKVHDLVADLDAFFGTPGLYT